MNDSRAAQWMTSTYRGRTVAHLVYRPGRDSRCGASTGFGVIAKAKPGDRKCPKCEKLG